MTDRPIIFSGAMVRAILAGQKTQTRRSLRGEPMCPTVCFQCQPCNICKFLPYRPGDRLWVRETWAAGACADGLSPAMLSPGFWRRDNGGLWYAADDAEPNTPVTPRGKRRPAIHMPRWASRITLTISDVRVQRLQEITDEDAVAEGVMTLGTPIGGWWSPLEGAVLDAIGQESNIESPPPIIRFAYLWNWINDKRAGKRWADNPWVVALTFTADRRNIDKMPSAANTTAPRTQEVA